MEDLTPETTPPKKKSVLKRVLKGLLWTVVTLVVLVGLTLAFFHLPVGKNIIRGLIEDGIAKRFDGQVTLGEFDWALFSDIQLKGLRIATPEGQDVINVAEITVTPDWGSLTSKPVITTAAISGVRVNIENFEDGTNTLKRMQRPVPAKLLDVAVESATIRDLEVFVKNPGDASLAIHRGSVDAALDLRLLSDGVVDFTLRDFSAEIVTIAPRTASALRVVEEGGTPPAWQGGTRATFPIKVSGNATIGWPGVFENGETGPIPPKGLPNLVKAAFTPTGGPVLIESPDTRLARASMTLPLSLPPITASLDNETLNIDVGALRFGPLNTQGLNVRTSLAKALAATPFNVAALDVDVAIKGVKMVAEELNALSAPPSADGKAPPLLLADLGAELTAKGPLSALVVTGNADWGPARLDVKGLADLSNSLLPVWEMTFTGKDIAPKAILAIPNAPDVAARFELWLKGRGIFPPDADIQTRLDMSGLSVNGNEVDTLTLAAGIVGEKISVTQLEIQVFGQKLVVTGEADRVTRTFKADVQARLDIARALSETTVAELIPAPLPRGSGTLSLDLAVDGRLSEKAMAALEEGVRAQRPPVLTNMPFDALNVHGKVRIEDLMFNTMKVGALAFDIDLKGEGGIPSGPLKLVVKDIAVENNGRMMLIDRVALDADVADKRGTFALEVVSESEKLDVKGTGELTVDPDARTGTLVVNTLEGKRGAFDVSLKEPMKLDLSEQGGRLAPLRLAIGGGALVIDGDVRVKPATADTPATIESFVLDVGLDGIDTGRLAAALGPKGRALAKMPARLNGYVRAAGTPTAPTADFHVTARTRARGKLPALTAVIDGRVSAPGANGRLTVKPTTTRGSKPWFDAAFDLPMIWPATPQEKPRLKPGGRMSVKADVLQRDLARWAELLGVEGLSGDIELGVDIGGTPARPRGDWVFNLDARGLVPPGRTTPLPPLKVAAKGLLKPASGRGIDHEGTADITSNNDRLSEASWRGHVATSPFLLPPGAPLPAWTVEAEFAQFFGPIAAFARDLLPPNARTTAVVGDNRGTLKAHGRGADLFVEYDSAATVASVSGPEALAPLAGVWPLTSALKLTLDEKELTLRQTTKLDAQRQDAVLSSAELKVGLSGRGLLRQLPALAKKRAVPALPLAAFFDAPERAPAELARLLGLPREVVADLSTIGGTAGGRIGLTGTLADPQLGGFVGWRGFKTLGNAPGVMGLEGRTTEDQLVLAMIAGPESRADEQLVTTVTLPRLPAILKAFAAQKTIPIAIAVNSKGTSLPDLTPAHPLLAKLPPVAGRLLADMRGVVAFAPGQNKLDSLGGKLTVEDLGLPLPGTRRTFKDGAVILSVSPERIALDNFEIHESDTHRADRWLKMQGGFNIAEGAVDLRVTSLDFLMGGLGPDAPDGELDIDLAIKATNVTGAPIKAELSFEHLDLDAPDRFVRAHHAQILSHGDVFDPALLGAKMPEAGKLPVPKSLVPPIPPNLDVAVAIIFPRPGRVGFFPLDIDLVGRLDAIIKDGAVDLRGQLDVTRGTLGAMGWDFVFDHGAISADGPLDTAKMELTFGLEPVGAALRETTVDGWHGGKAYITARATLAKGLETIFSGVGGPNVLDMATLVNTGRTRLWGAPDVPSSGAVRFGNRDQGLVNTFIATNLRNFIFMDRTLGYSDSLVEHERFGRIEWFDMQRFVPDSDTRVAMKSRPLGMGVNQLELLYDWLLVNNKRSVAGFGPRLGIDAKLGLGFFWEWSSAD